MDNIDEAGFPKRKIGDKLIIDSRRVIVKVVMEPAMLCKCPDRLTVEYMDKSMAEVDNDNYDTWEYLGTIILAKLD